ncbi:hypothetical protein J3A83DRAFT_3677118 [Scleroderma citrinum]
MESGQSSILATLTYVILVVIAACDITTGVLSVVAIAAGVTGTVVAFITTISFGAVLIIFLSLLHKYLNRYELASNVANLVTFGTLWLTGLGLCIGSTVEARKSPLCHRSSTAAHSCGVIYGLLIMAYLSFILALVGFGVSWANKYPGVVEVRPRYKITKAPSSHFAALAHPLDEELTHKIAPYPVRPAPCWHVREPIAMLRHDHWSDVPL